MIQKRMKNVKKLAILSLLSMGISIGVALFIVHKYHKNMTQIITDIGDADSYLRNYILNDEYGDGDEKRALKILDALYGKFIKYDSKK